MADRLLDKVCPAIRRVDAVPFPGSEHEIGILQLTCGEIEDAELAAREHLAKRGLNLDAAHAGDLLARERDVQLVLRMAVDPQSKGQPEHRAFKSADEVRQRLSVDQRENLIEWHLKHQGEILSAYSWPGAEA